ncbi:hypothetical protein ACCQ08_25505, partial [Comamonas sp. SY3]|uniref:hypothetical protein n=1 Tax=Comamonas sp. SY3 TaxID=3243601 RepID=UPI003593F265
THTNRFGVAGSLLLLRRLKYSESSLNVKLTYPSKDRKDSLYVPACGLQGRWVSFKQQKTARRRLGDVGG